MTQAQINKAIAKGVAERKKAHWAKMLAEEKAFDKRIASCKTTKDFDDLKEVISELSGEQYRQHYKNVEYKHYEDAGFNDDYREMYDEIDTKLWKRRQELGL
jgi:DNA-binding ferritin-like protein (Dps family)